MAVRPPVGFETPAAMRSIPQAAPGSENSPRTKRTQFGAAHLGCGFHYQNRTAKTVSVKDRRRNRLKELETEQLERWHSRVTRKPPAGAQSALPRRFWPRRDSLPLLMRAVTFLAESAFRAGFFFGRMKARKPARRPARRQEWLPHGLRLGLSRDQRFLLRGASLVSCPSGS